VVAVAASCSFELHQARNLMSVLFNHGIRHDIGGRNPIRLVRQSAKRRKIPLGATHHCIHFGSDSSRAAAWSPCRETFRRIA
jgi:hypothetical protein